MQTKVYINNQEIDISDSQLDAVALSYAITDATNITKRKSSGSKVIKAPGTRRNRLIFGFPEDVSSDSALSQNQLIYGKIEIDGVTVLNGVVRFRKPVTENSQTEYQFIIIGQNSWKDALAEKSINDLDWSGYDHYLDPFFIKDSHANLQERFYTYFSKKGTGPGVYPEDFWFAINIRRVFLMIFKEAGYRIKSDFIDSEYFSKLYYLPEVNERDSDLWKSRSVKATSHVDVPSQIDTWPVQTGVQYIEWPLEANYVDQTKVDQNGVTIQSDYADLQNQYGINNGYTYAYLFTPKFNCGWSYKYSIPISRQKYTASSGDEFDKRLPTEFYVDFMYNGVAINTHFFSGTSREFIDNPILEGEFNVGLEVGDLVYLRIRFLVDYSSVVPFGFVIPQWGIVIDIQPSKQPVSYEFVRLNDFYRSDAKHIDFVKDLVVLFNLHFITDEATKTIYVEPEGNFYKSTLLDITEKLSISDKIEVNLLNESYGKDIKFTYPGGANSKTLNNSNRFATGGTENALSFFNAPIIEKSYYPFEASVVIDEPDNQIISANLISTDDYLLYHKNGAYLGPSAVTYNKALQADFNNANVNLSFADGDIPGIISTFYRDLYRDLNTLKIVKCSVLWDVLDINRIEGTDSTGADYRAKYYLDGIGPVRLIEISDFMDRLPSDTIFRQDNIKSPISVNVIAHSPALINSHEIYIQAFEYENFQFSAGDLSVDFNFTIQNLSAVHTRTVTIFLPFFNESAPYTLTFTLTPGQVRQVQFSGIVNTDGTDSLFQFVPLPNHQHLYLSGHARCPVDFTYLNYAGNNPGRFIKKYGVFNQVPTVNTPFTFDVNTYNRNVSVSGIVSLSMPGAVISTIPSMKTWAVEEEKTETFTITAAKSGWYTYTITWGDGSGGIFTQLKHKVYVHE